MKKLLENKKKIAIISGILVAVIAVGSIGLKANAAIKVDSYAATKGSISRTTEINGKIVSNLKKDYYTKIDGVVGTVHVKKGDAVKKGDLLISYDKDDLDLRISLNDLSVEEAEEKFNGKTQAAGRVAGLYSQASSELATLEEQILIYQSAIVSLDDQIARKKAALASEGANLQISLIECDPDDYEELSKQVQRNAYEQGYNRELTELEETRACYSTNLADCKTKRAEMTSQKNSSYTSMMTKGDKAALELDKEMSDIKAEDKAKDLAEAADGIRAEFDGIVTSIDVTEGTNVGIGDKLLSLDSTSDIVVRSNVNKYDIENITVGQTADVRVGKKHYSGKVTRIERMAGADEGESNNVGTEITLDAPDDGIILGVETKSAVNTADLEDVLLIPEAAINEDENGTYVFVEKSGKANKVYVEIGVKNGDMAEVISGLNECDKVIWNDTTELTDGQDVKC